MTDLGAAFAIAIGGVVTLFIAAPPNGLSVWVRAVNEVTGAVFEQEITADLPAATQFLSPRLFMNTGATAAAVAYDRAGVYVETDFLGGGRIRPPQRMRPPFSMAGIRPLGWRKLEPAWRAPRGFAAIPAAALDPAHRPASPAVPALSGPGPHHRQQADR